MKVMILNSGLARRLRPLTDNTHKSLIDVAGKSILERQLESFKKIELNDFIITTGPFEDKIKNLINNKFPNINVTYVNNNIYDSTNYIYSMWLARDKIDDDFILMHGDLVYQPSVARKIVKNHNKKKNLVVIDKNAPLPEKDFKGRIEGGLIKEIGIDVFGDNAFFLLPFYYFKQKSFRRWMKEIDKFIQNNNNSCYAENAFNQISDEIKLYPMELNGEFCMEIDTAKDLEKANKEMKKI